MREDRLPGAKQPSSWSPWLPAIGVALATLLGTLGLMKLLGLLDVPEDDTGNKTLAAALTLVGAIVASSITMVGIVLKYAIDERNYALAVEAEKRNRVDAAIRAVALLGQNNKDNTPAQMGGALLALVSLGQHDLAVALLAQLWPKDLVSVEVADMVLTRALVEGQEVTCVSAAVVAFNNADKLNLGDTHFWPIPQNGWRRDLPRDGRYALALAAAKWLATDVERGSLNMRDAAVVLAKALDDPDVDVSHVAATCLLPWAEYNAGTSWKPIYEGAGMFRVDDLLTRLRGTDLLPDLTAAAIAERIRRAIQAATSESAAEVDLDGAAVRPAVQESSIGARQAPPLEGHLSMPDHDALQQADGDKDGNQ